MTEVPRRLAPTPETVRRLFLLSGNQCAFSGCMHPIILEAGQYVGEICHIQAAESGGERFESTQTNEQRRSFENLLLMCHDHHVVTNDVSAYPVPRMLDMKTQHEARFERGLSSMMESQAVSIIDSVVSLGGAGGAAPGAGGGGGGAIGPGSRAGDGGQGGEVKHGFFEIPSDLVALRVQVGKGGEARSDGGSGGSGEDSVVEAVYRDGTINELLRAEGGRGGASGTGRAAVGWAVLANSAEIREGLLFIMGAAWHRYTITSLPYPSTFAVCFVAEPDQAGGGTVSASVLDPNSKLVTMGSQAFDFANGSVPAVFRFLVPLDQLGTWTVVLSSDDREMRRLPFDVISG